MSRFKEIIKTDIGLLDLISNKTFCFKKFQEFNISLFTEIYN